MLSRGIKLIRLSDMVSILFDFFVSELAVVTMLTISCELSDFLLTFPDD